MDELDKALQELIDGAVSKDEEKLAKINPTLSKFGFVLKKLPDGQKAELQEPQVQAQQVRHEISEVKVRRLAAFLDVFMASLGALYANSSITFNRAFTRDSREMIDRIRDASADLMESLQSRLDQTLATKSLQTIMMARKDLEKRVDVSDIGKISGLHDNKVVASANLARSYAAACEATAHGMGPGFTGYSAILAEIYTCMCLVTVFYQKELL